MKKFLLLPLALLCLITACKNKEKEKNLVTITGQLINSKAHKIYLEEVPIGSDQPMVVDSAAIDKDGKFKLKSAPVEEIVYNLRLDELQFPVVSVVSDKPEIELSIKMGNINSDYAETYEVKGSPASQLMKDYTIRITKGLQSIYSDYKLADSCQKAGADSLVQVYELAQKQTAADLKNYSLQSVGKATNPALAIFNLTYYLSASENPAYGLEALTDQDVATIVTDLAKKFPAHNGLTALKVNIDNSLQKKAAASPLGKQAPDFELPDPNGHVIKLSSFRGKYVLVDFWASWCAPCRHENPNVVKAYNTYKDKNFEILGVSLDKEKAPWVKAISDDKLAWTQVSDLQFWQGPIVALYNVISIPYNILIDPDGKVIGESLTGAALENKLATVLK